MTEPRCKACEAKMRGPKITPTVKLSGENGNAFNVMGLVSEALREHGADKEYITKYFQESTAGNYDNLLRVAMKFANII
jgi:hypothetical protein